MIKHRKSYIVLAAICLCLIAFICVYFGISKSAFDNDNANTRNMIQQAIETDELTDRGFIKSTISTDLIVYEWHADDLVRSYYSYDSQIFGAYQKSIDDLTIEITKCYDRGQYILILNDESNTVRYSTVLDYSLSPISDSSFLDNCVPTETVNNEDSYNSILGCISAEDIENTVNEYEQFTKQLFNDIG
ncbi:MAG: hypothetical protein J6L81_02440 [Clostridia bacterium]|nr:hypothetical protein [Clostridia bacterium]